MSLKDVQKIDTDKQRRLRAMMNKANSKKTVIAFAGDVPNCYTLRRPTGITQLDLALHGGWPAGTLNCLSGPKGSGKTVLLYKSMAMQQRIYGANSLLALCAKEATPDYFFMRECGVQVAIPDEIIEQKERHNKLIGLSAFTKEQIKDFKKQVGEIVLVDSETGEESLDIVLDMLGSKMFSLICIDSFTSFLPSAEVDQESLGDSVQQAANASLLTKFFKKASALLSGLTAQNQTTVLGISQVRANRERANAPSHIQKYLPAYIPSLPYAAEHFLSVIVLVTPGEKIKEKAAKGERGEQIGKVMAYHFLKGRAGIHEGIRGEIDYNFDEKIDDAQTLIDAALLAGVLSEKSGKLTIHRANGEETQVPGFDELKSAIESQADFDMLLRQEVLHSKGIECVYW